MKFFYIWPVMVKINNHLIVTPSFTGLSLFGVSGSMGINLSAMHALTFASLIAAVDPVAVSTLQNSLNPLNPKIKI